MELTHLLGALGFAQAVEALSSYRLICVDEFELDDPGDTVLVSTLLSRLSAAGVRLAATSNTLPGSLGEGRFAAQDFLREIQSLSGHFEVHRIEGEDYRHRGRPTAPDPETDARVHEAAATHPAASLDHFVDLCRHLPEVHPSRYGALLDGLAMVCLEDVRQVEDQALALRLVVLADRLYDRDLPVVASGIGLDRLFAEKMLGGGYRKKYFRAISRLTALAREAAELLAYRLAGARAPVRMSTTASARAAAAVTSRALTSSLRRTHSVAASGLRPCATCRATRSGTRRSSGRSRCHTASNRSRTGRHASSSSR